MGRLNVKAKFISTYNNQISQSEVKPIQFVASVMELCGDQLCHLACDPTQSLRNRLPPCSSSVISVILSGLPLKLHSTVKSKWSGLLLKIQSYLNAEFLPKTDAYLKWLDIFIMVYLLNYQHFLLLHIRLPVYCLILFFNWPIKQDVTFGLHFACFSYGLMNTECSPKLHCRRRFPASTC